MARVLAVQTGAQQTPDPGIISLVYDGHLAGTDVPGGYTATTFYVSITMETDTAAMINTKVAQAAVAAAAGLGITVAQRNVVFAGYVRG